VERKNRQWAIGNRQWATANREQQFLLFSSLPLPPLLLFSSLPLFPTNKQVGAKYSAID